MFVMLLTIRNWYGTNLIKKEVSSCPQESSVVA